MMKVREVACVFMVRSGCFRKEVLSKGLTRDRPLESTSFSENSSELCFSAMLSLVNEDVPEADSMDAFSGCLSR